MKAGVVVAERYELELQVGAGGMGEVYRARDVVAGGHVAIKLLTADEPELVRRFQKEAAALASLTHPGIVRYVGHGEAASGRRYLVMEWLDGEDLATRLRRGPLGVAETVALAQQACAALAAAHARGIVHRDIKPGNLFLVHGEELRLKLLDFGIARLDLARTATRPGAVLGSPGYSAPEQVRGATDVDARADVFSLGCVLHECLVGRPPFAGEHFLAILAKILFDETPDVRGARPEVPAALAELIRRMLAKDVADRPVDAAAVGAGLAALGELPAAAVAPRPAAVTTSEQRFVSVLVAGRALSQAATVPPAAATARSLLLEALATQHGARVAPLADGTLVAVFAPGGVATDAAARAARFSLALRELLPEPAVALVTARTVIDGALPVGEALDRAARLLAEVGSTCETRVDDTTAGLLEARFELDAAGRLLAERVADGTRLLLGKATPFVGRERELATLSALLDECIEARAPRVALIIAPAGMGKSRLRHELLKLATVKGVQIWAGAGDPMRSGSPLGLVAEMLRGVAGLAQGSAKARREALAERVARHVSGADRARIAEFLGEMCGVPFPDAGNVQLQAARQDPMLMGDQLHAAFEDFLAAESAAGPLLVALEDLHWGDWSSFKFVDRALRNLRDRPLFVVATARPEVHEQFPGLWADRRVEELPLRELGRGAGTRLVHEVLGSAVSAGVVERMVDQCGGNPFYLEEIIRASAAPPGEGAPESVLAMVQSRLALLPAEVRQVARAASVFGQTTWAGGVAVLVGVSAGPALTRLVEDEWLQVRRVARLEGQNEYEFGHALLREAAYATLTDADRALAHRLAAAWLEGAGERQPLALAQHWQRGGDPARAIRWYRRAAELALEGDDLDSAVKHAEQGVSCGATGETLGALRLLQAEALNWRGKPEPALEHALEGKQRLPPGSTTWSHAVHHAGWACTSLGREDLLSALGKEMLAQAHLSITNDPVVAADIATLSGLLDHAGRPAEGQRLLEAFESRCSEEARSHPRAMLAVSARRGIAAAGESDPMAVEHWRVAIQQATAVGSRRDECMHRVNLAFALISCGDYALGVAEARRALPLATTLALGELVPIAMANLGLALTLAGDLSEAWSLLRESADGHRAHGAERGLLLSIIYQARNRVAARELELATQLIAEAEAIADGHATARAYSRAVAAWIDFLAGRHDAARVRAGEAATLLASFGTSEGREFIRLICAEGLHAAGDLHSAKRAIEEARTDLLANAEKIRDAAARSTYLNAVPEHARTLALAAEWGIGEPSP